MTLKDTQKPLMNLNDQTEIPVEPVMNERIEGLKLYYAPQPVLTAVATDTVDSVYGLAESNVLNNVRLRLNELEGNLIKLNLIKGTSS